MAKTFAHAVLGVSILAGSVAAGVPARATVWKNYKNENFCMGASGGHMTPGTPIILWDCDSHPDQSWGEANPQQVRGNTSYHTYYQIYDEEEPAPENAASMCVALGQNGSITYENPAVIWNCPVVTWDQFFWPAYGFNDGNGHACYVFISAKAQIESPNLWEVLEPYMFYMNDGNPVVINQEVGNSAEYWCAY